MPRPQFTIRTLLWLALAVAGLCLAWVSMDPLAATWRLAVEFCILLWAAIIAYAARVSRLIREGKVRSGWTIFKEWWFTK